MKWNNHVVDIDAGVESGAISPVHAWEWGEKFRKLNDMKQIGSGAFATVYGRDDEDVVYKFGVCNATRFDDDAYISYLRDVVAKYPGNPLLPKIDSVDLFTLNYRYSNERRIVMTDMVYIVRMEKLIPFGKMKADIVARELWKHGARETYDFENAEFTARFDSTGNFRIISRALMKLMNRHSEDIHEGNVMWRKDGRRKSGHHLVITDPVC